MRGQQLASDRIPVHRDRDEFREEPRGEQRVADGWDFLGGLALLVPLFGGAYALDVWIRRWPEVAPFIAVLGAVAMVAVIGGMIRWMDRASRARQGMTRRQELISARAWTCDVVGTVALAVASIPYLALFIRQDNWTDLGAAVACLLTSGLWLRKVLRLRGHRVPAPR